MTMDNTETPGERVRRLRDEKGLTQQELATAAGMSEKGLRNLEAGRSNPMIGTFRALAEALGVPLGDILASGHGANLPPVYLRFKKTRAGRLAVPLEDEVLRLIAGLEGADETLLHTVFLALRGEYGPEESPADAAKVTRLFKYPKRGEK